LICSEFYPGWFDTWGQRHHYGNTDKYLTDLGYMLSHDASFSIYMAHGGTTFGLWSGCDRPFKPDTSSYDYDAPITEAGWTTEKFFATRDLISKYLMPGETLPDPPAQNPVITFAPVEIENVAPIFDNLPDPLSAETPPNMESCNQGYGCILYRTTLPAGAATTLEAAAIHDFGYVYLDGKRIGILDRRNATAKLPLPARASESRLDILVEPMGRINFGPEMADHKGLIAPVKLGGIALTGWEVYNLPLDQKMLSGLKFTHTKPAPDTAGFWWGHFNLAQVGDTFLDLRGWGKGDVWVNDHCLGRFWDIGPTQTTYAPGCWLHSGENEIVIFDVEGPRDPKVAGLDKPVLDELHKELDFQKATRPSVTLNLNSPVQTGTFAPGADAQEIKLNAPATGKYFCLESVNAQDGKPFAAVAELDLLGPDGRSISHEGWTIAYVDSEELSAEDDAAENAIDGQTANFWHTQYADGQPDHPHRLILDLGSPQTISGFIYTPRQSEGAGRVKDYRIYVGDTLVRK
jgi:beta-galactosidase